MKALSDKKHKLIFCAVLLMQLLCVLYFGHAKQGYFVDELWSYGLANSYYHPHVYSDNALEGTWVSGDYFREYLEVLPNQRFRYGSVLFNQKNDAHPPLFYMVLHTISSLFPDTFSKWYGILPNIFYFLMSILVLYRLSRRLFKNEWLALSVVVAYGFSAGAISNVIYIRMYMLLSLWITAFLELHVRWLLEKHIRSRDLIRLMVIAYLGCMTHYYFFIVAFLSASFFAVYLLAGKKIVDAFRYCIAMVLNLFWIAVTFPTAYKKLFFDQRGSEAVQNLFDLQGLLEHAKKYWDILSEQLFANHLNLLAGVLLAGMICVLICRMQKRSEEEQYGEQHLNLHALKHSILSGNGARTSALLLMWVLCSYFAVIVKIAPYQVDRYIFGMYPVAVLLTFYLLYQMLCCLCLETAVPVLMLFLAIGLAAFGVNGRHVAYIYANHKNNVKIMEEHEGEACLYITYDYYKLAGNALELEHMGTVHADIPDRIEELPSSVDPDIDRMIVYIDEDFNQEEILNRLCGSLGFTSWEPLFESRCLAYELRKA